MKDLAVEKTKQLLGERVAQVYATYYQRLQEMPGADNIFKRISDSTHREKILDYLAEVRYALAFTGLGFDVRIEPFGKEGADFLITQEVHQVVVEVTRFRKMYPGPPELDLSNNSSMLSEYGNVKRDVRKAIRKIYKKFSQIGDREAVIAIWNDDEDMEEIEVATAAKNLQGDDSLPEGLLFVLYSSKWIGPAGQQLYCFPVRNIVKPHYCTLVRELESHTLQSLIQRALV